jgi:ribA/ribD-fused uncharacterized protein
MTGSIQMTAGPDIRNTSTSKALSKSSQGAMLRMLHTSRQIKKRKIEDDTSQNTMRKAARGSEVLTEQSAGHEPLSSPALFTPLQLLCLIGREDAWKLNPPYRGLKGALKLRLQPGRWLVMCKDREHESIENSIYFFDHRERYGGPFAFLSTYYPCEFSVKPWHGCEECELCFTSAEQMYQYTRTKIIKMASGKTMFAWDQWMNSKDLCAAVLKGSGGMNECQELDEAIDDFGTANPEWLEEWRPVWQIIERKTLRDAVYAKYDQNEELKQLLLMTGDFLLADVDSPDKHRGTGDIPEVAWQSKSDWGHNIHGEVLMEVRQELREKYYPNLTRDYNFEYWRLWEEHLNEKRYMDWERKNKGEKTGARLPSHAELPNEDVMAELARLRAKYFEGH